MISMTIAQTRSWMMAGLVAFGFCCLLCDGVAEAQQLSPEVREHVKNATGQILMGSKKRGEDKIEGRGWGSGWFINSTGLMVTNSHVVNPTHYALDPFTAFQDHNAAGITQYEVTLRGGTETEKTYRGERMYVCESADLAFLQVYDEDSKPLSTPYSLKLLPSDQVVKGQRVFAIGYPHGDRMATSRDKHAPVTITAGNIIDIVYAPSGRIKKFRSDAEIVGGNSGGPLVDERGRLIGVNVEGGVDVSEEAGVSAGQIPGAVIIDFLRGALGLNKIDTALEPFLPFLVDKNLHVFVPGKVRKKGIDVIQFEDGEESEGRITDEKLTWNTPFGPVTVPTNRVGFALNDNGKAILLLDGGERITADAADIQFKFVNDRDQHLTVKLADLRSVLFRKQTGKIDFPDLDAVELVGEGCKLYLTGVKGEIKFDEEGNGPVTLKLEDIRRIDSMHFKQTIHKFDGAKITGKFKPHQLTAKLVLLDAPITFSLEQAKSLTLRRINPAEIVNDKTSLAMRLEIDDQALLKIAGRLDAGESKQAGAMLDELLEPAALKAREKPLREQILVLNAERLLRGRKYQDASAGFKKLRRAKIEGVQWYAKGRYHVLKNYPDGKFTGLELSDPSVFNKAATEISDKILADAHELMAAQSKIKISHFNDWKGLEASTGRIEKSLGIATSLILQRGERTMFQMWRFRQDLNWKTLKWLFEEDTRFRSDFETRRANGKPVQGVARKLVKIRKQIETVRIKYRDLRQRMNPLGDGPSYRVDDPDAADFLTAG